MNGEHLSPDTPTVFETLDDADVRTAGTTYLMYRGRHRHEVTNETALTRIASAVFKEPVLGPREFFYADIFASRRTGCRSQLGLPGRARPARRLRRPVPGRARPVRLPAALAARQRHALAQARPGRAGHLAGRRRPADRAADARRRRAGRVPRGPRGHRLLGPLAVAGRGRDRPVPRLRRVRRAAAERRARDEDRNARRSPSARARAPRRSTCWTGTPARGWSHASSGRCWRSRASTS